mmetsp:Transcript_16018/g.15425  ORF Transcript_16018/g.15425 Transcript_16018/m.15425 type:complete len:237 (+) Transcript_16018:789-1499(+)
MLSKKKTHFQLKLQYGDSEKLFKINLVSNGDPTPKEFESMCSAFSRNSLTKDHVFQKVVDITKARTYVYSEGEIEQNVRKNINKIFKEWEEKGKLQGVNLTYLKMNLTNDLAIAQARLGSSDLSQEEREQYEAIVQDHQRKLEIIQSAVQDQINQENMIKAKPVLTDNGLEKEFISIEELETIKKALEWEENQERLMKHPELKQNTIFMNFKRQDSIEAGVIEQKTSLHLELSLMR